MYANCPIHWASRLQTKIAFSTADAEYIALSSALREVIPLMTLHLIGHTSRGGIKSFLFVRKDWNPSLLSGLFFCPMTIQISN